MRIFVAGASGAIGLPLIAELVRRGHTVTGMTSSEAGAKKVIEQGAAAELANAFEMSSVEWTTIHLRSASGCLGLRNG
jgi:2-alkyl-3-oxoalkanoate reductase